MIWWIWTAWNPVKVVEFDVNATWREHDGFRHEDLRGDVAWLGEGSWTARADNAGIGLVSV